MVPMSSGNQRKVAQSSAKNNRNWFAWSENDVQQNVMQPKRSCRCTQLEMQFGDAKSDFRLHAFKSLGLHRNGSGQWRTHDHPWPKLNRQFRCSDCLVGLITDISTATKISAKPTSELHMIVSPQNSAENVTANRLSVHMMIDACEAGT